MENRIGDHVDLPSGMAQSITESYIGGFMDEYPKKSKEEPHERTLEAIWCWDSETGDKRLMDLRTGKEIGRWKTDGTQSDS